MADSESSVKVAEASAESAVDTEAAISVRWEEATSVRWAAILEAAILLEADTREAEDISGDHTVSNFLEALLMSVFRYE